MTGIKEICGLAMVGIAALCSCQKEVVRTEVQYVTVRDTICMSMPASITYNIPCKVLSFNSEKEGPARLVILLHGGVHDLDRHTFLGPSHLDYVKNDEIICDYLKESGEKSIFIAPICHKANKRECVSWAECSQDIKQIIDDYIACGWVDPSQIYITGGSDGGRGTWAIATKYPNLFAAIMPMSCGGNSMLLQVPTYWHSTRSEGDFTAQAESQNQRGAHIIYKYHGDVGHGIDCNRITKELLDQFFSHRRNPR